MKILIADDDKALVHMLASKLSERGFEIFAAYDAIQAWMAVMRYVPDAVVLDVSMPGGTGIEVLRKLKQFPKTSAIPSVIISGLTETSLAEKARALGAASSSPMTMPLPGGRWRRCLPSGVMP
jgi:CheY-like chemotaxis protein